MSLTDPFVRRPVMTTLVMIAILGAGLLAYVRLPVSDLPSVDFPTINVSAGLPGVSPETMASSVATPLENEFSAIAGIQSMTSKSALGTTTITIQFDLSRNIDAAAQDVQAAISQALGNLPVDMPSPPSFRKVDPAEQPILILTAWSESLPNSKVDEFADTLIGQRLSMVSGVAEVDIYGSQRFAVRVKVDPRELAVVFLPVIFMGGILGRLLNEFSVTIAVAILLSGFVSLSLTPMLCRIFLKKAHGESRHPVFLWSEALFAKWLALYERTLRVAMRHHVWVSAIAVATAIGTVWLFLVIPKGFLPNEDTGRIMISTEGEQGVAFDQMIELQHQVSAIVAENPHVEKFLSRLGGGGGARASNTGRLFLTLKPRSDRPPVDDVVRELRRDLAGIPGLKVFPQNPPTIRIGALMTKSLYQFTLFGLDLEALYEAAPRLEERLRTIPGLLDVSSDLQITSPQVIVDIQRDRAASLGVTAARIERALGSAYSGRQISTIYTPNNQFRVILEAEEAFTQETEDLERLYVRSSSGRLVPLGAVASFQKVVGPLTVQHLGQLPAVTLSFDLAKGCSLGQVVPEIERVAAEELDDSISTRFQGAAQEFQSSIGNLGLLLLMAVIVIYIILGILYESFIHPLTILSGLPSAAFGALLTLVVFGMELNIYGFVGLLLLIGIVKKNAIMMIDFALEAQRNDHLPPERAIFDACLVRFRAIMMTTLSAMAGILPIALGIGAGGEVRTPLGVSVIGGLFISQLVTLFLTPVLYVYLERLKKRFARRNDIPAPSPA